MESTRDKAFEYLYKDEAHFIAEAPEVHAQSRYGFTLNQLRLLSDNHALTYEDLNVLTVEQSKELLYRFYWKPLRCDEFPPGLDYFLFDSGVVHGKDVAKRWLQFSVHTEPTGEFNVRDFRGVEAIGAGKCIERMEAYRRRFVRSHPSWLQNSSIWTNRITRVKARALKMVNNNDKAHDA